jgi:hypothetical protein
MVRILTLLTALCLFAFAVMPAAAQDGGYFYDSGAASFSFAQTPFPIYSGSFAAEGEALPDGGGLPASGQAAAAGMAPVTVDSVATAIYAAADNGDGTWDLVFLALRTEGEPTPGDYPVDLDTAASLFAFVDDAQVASFPDTLDQDIVVDWLMSLPAAHKFASISGSIQLSGADPDTLHGSFSGLCVDLDNVSFLINVTGGQFAMSGQSITAVPDAGLTLDLRAYPNPFNPQTAIRFELPVAGAVEAVIHDIAGRRVRTLHQGELPAGSHGLVWDGLADGGGMAPAGMYLATVRSGPWRQAVKLTLVP